MYHLFKLERDPAIVMSSYGHDKFSTMLLEHGVRDVQIPLSFTLATVEPSSKLSLQFYKTVERLKAVPIFVERLFVEDGNWLIPIRISYITGESQRDYVFTRHLNDVVYSVNRLAVHAVPTPVRLVTDHILPSCGYGEEDLHGRLSSYILDNHNKANGVTKLFTDLRSLTDMLNERDPRSREARLLQLQTELCLQKFIPMTDALTTKSITDRIHKSELSAYMEKTVHSDISVPPPIYVDGLSSIYPREFYSAPEIIEQYVWSTDYRLTLQICNGCITGYDNQTFDRYGRKNFFLRDDTVRFLGYNLWSRFYNNPHALDLDRLVDQVELIVTKTHNEEMSIVLMSTPHQKQSDVCLASVYIDLAYLTLCQTGIKMDI